VWQNRFGLFQVIKILRNLSFIIIDVTRVQKLVFQVELIEKNYNWLAHKLENKHLQCYLSNANKNKFSNSDD